jgi:hypothetical protein
MTDNGGPEGSHISLSEELLEDDNVSEDSGMTLYVKVNYKVILLVAVIFDFLHLSIDELVARLLRRV